MPLGLDVAIFRRRDLRHIETEGTSTCLTSSLSESVPAACLNRLRSYLDALIPLCVTREPMRIRMGNAERQTEIRSGLTTSAIELSVLDCHATIAYARGLPLDNEIISPSRSLFHQATDGQAVVV